MEPTVEAGVGLGSGPKPALGPVVQIDEGCIQAHLDEVVRSTVEDTLNALLDAEADRLCGAKRYERSEGRKDTRAGSYDRKLLTKAGEVALSMPKLRTLPFETAIIERYRRRESSVEEALIRRSIPKVGLSLAFGSRHTNRTLVGSVSIDATDGRSAYTAYELHAPIRSRY